MSTALGGTSATTAVRGATTSPATPHAGPAARAHGPGTAAPEAPRRSWNPTAETYLALGVVIVVALLVMPLPPFLLDAFLALSFGLSIALFVRGLRRLGVIQTGMLFALAPGFAAILSWTILHEQIAGRGLAALLVMTGGALLLVLDRHEHRHEHEATVHEHEHTHDGHHQHLHDAAHPAQKPHTHEHRHEATTHAHGHLHDVHHRHRHGH